MYTHEVTVTWGESDPFGLVYYPCILAWFNDTEHELLRRIGYPVDKMIRGDRTAFVMGDLQFRFVGPAACGDRIECTMEIREVRTRTVRWNCKAVNTTTGRVITEGQATRIYAHLADDGSLTSVEIPDALRQALGTLAP